jgi:benzoyl-CoA reductase subunit C
MIEMFQAWYENRHAYAKGWKEKTGGKVLGYFCTQIPEEIVYAALILPVRILDRHEPPQGAQPPPLCRDGLFCRDSLAPSLQDRYDYLDGILISPSCPQIRQAFTRRPGLIFLPSGLCLTLPHQVRNPQADPAAELSEFKKSIEDWTGKAITDADLDRGIEILNESRRLLGQAFETRKKDNPPLTGLEAMYVSYSGQWIDKREHNRVLKDVLEKELPTRDLKLGDQIRLMILGGQDNNTEFVKMVESLEAKFVIDDHDTGTRTFRNEVIPGADRMAAIAVRYLDQPPGPTDDRSPRRRLEHILKLAKDWRVQGAIILRQKFPDSHELDIPTLRQVLDGVGVPSLFLEPDVTVPVGQFKFRVAAFLEMLRPEDLF